MARLKLVTWLGLVATSSMFIACGGGDDGNLDSAATGTGGTGATSSGTSASSGTSGGASGGAGSTSGTAGGAASGGASGTSTGTAAGGTSSASTSTVVSAGCDSLINDPQVNWRESTLQTDQEIVECLATTLGTPVGYGENATGGYNPAGGSELVVITKSSSTSVEQQVLDAVSGEEYKWIVFDKDEFADPSEIAMYRLNCGDAAMQTALGITSTANCLDYEAWCTANGVASASCLDTFFNDRLNISMSTVVKQIHSNKTIDGRQSQAHFLFSGFKIGADSNSSATEIDSNVIVTNMLFKGAGHAEDHLMDPDMIRSTGESHDIWIHQNTFEFTGDSAYDVKRGAYNITMSFNLLKNVQRAALHASSDTEALGAQIATTMHHNAFITTDDMYDTFGGAGRRVPLLRLGRSHMFNNVFYNYRREVMSVRAGGSIAFENNMFLENTTAANSAGDDLDYYADELLGSAFVSGAAGLEVTGSYVWLSDSSCNLDAADSRDLSGVSEGTTPDMLSAYNAASQATITANLLDAGTELADYVLATAGKGGAVPFSSPLTQGQVAIMALGHTACTQ